MASYSPFSPRLEDHKLFGCSALAYVQGCVNFYRALLAGKVTDRELRELRAGRAFIANAASTTTATEFASVEPPKRREIASAIGDLLGKLDAVIMQSNRVPKAKHEPFGRWPKDSNLLNLI